MHHKHSKYLLKLNLQKANFACWIFYSVLFGLVFTIITGCKKSKNDRLTVTDIDGNAYSVIEISGMRWMKENLNTSRYRNGDLIPHIQDSIQWANTSTGAWCYYENNSGNGQVYGRLYNWHAVHDPRGLAPQGWYIPTETEWTALSNVFGGDAGSGGELKETGFEHWTLPNAGATNSSGFTALGGGLRTYQSIFYNIKYLGSWWSADEGSLTSAWLRTISYNDISMRKFNLSKNNGYSVRCISD